MSTTKSGNVPSCASGEQQDVNEQDGKSTPTTSPSPPNGLVSRIKPVTSPRTSMKLLALQHLANVFVASRKQEKSTGSKPGMNNSNSSTCKHGERSDIEQPFESMDPALELAFEDDANDELFSFIETENNGALRNLE